MLAMGSQWTLDRTRHYRMEWHKAVKCSRQEMRCASSLTLTLCSLPHYLTTSNHHGRLPLALQRS